MSVSWEFVGGDECELVWVKSCWEFVGGDECELVLTRLF